MLDTSHSITTMTKFVRHIIFLCLIFQMFSCDTVTNKKTENQVAIKTENIFGLYSYYVTGYHSHCETVKHSLRLNTDSTFIFKIYCYADSTSPFKQAIKIGKWTKQRDSVFRLVFSDTTTFDIELLTTEKLKIIRPIIDDKINFEFAKDTSRDEMDWQKPSKQN